MRGTVYALRQQCAQLRETQGFSEEEAARRVGVTVERLRAARRPDLAPGRRHPAGHRAGRHQAPRVPGGPHAGRGGRSAGVPLAWVKARKARRHRSGRAGALGPAAAVPLGTDAGALCARRCANRSASGPGGGLAAPQRGRIGGRGRAATLLRWADDGELARKQAASSAATATTARPCERAHGSTGRRCVSIVPCRRLGWRPRARCASRSRRDRAQAARR